jgi:hypothetical protein
VAEQERHQRLGPSPAGLGRREQLGQYGDQERSEGRRVRHHHARSRRVKERREGEDRVGGGSKSMLRTNIPQRSHKVILGCENSGLRLQNGYYWNVTVGKSTTWFGPTRLSGGKYLAGIGKAVRPAPGKASLLPQQDKCAIRQGFGPEEYPYRDMGARRRVYPGIGKQQLRLCRNSTEVGSLRS